MSPSHFFCVDVHDLAILFLSMGSELMHLFDHCKFSVVNYLASFQVKEHLLLELLMIMVMVGQLLRFLLPLVLRFLSVHGCL